MRAYMILICVTLTLGAGISSGQQITVRLINGKTGRPFLTTAGKVEIWSYDSMPSPSNRSMNKVAPDFQILERPDGTATFQLPHPVPPVICANPDVPFHSLVICSDQVCFRAERVYRSGVIPANKCDPKGKLKSDFIPKPGEIILFVRRYTFWDTL